MACVSTRGCEQRMKAKINDLSSAMHEASLKQDPSLRVMECPFKGISAYWQSGGWLIQYSLHTDYN